MSHATDGQLEAHLDGALASFDPVGSERLIAHLEACADCRRRLEAAEGTRQRAGEILDGVLRTPVEVPPFEEVRVRAGQSGTGAGPAGSGSHRGGRRIASARLAWAASVAIAVGAGWMGHAVWSGESAPRGSADAPAASLESRVGRIDSAERDAFRAPPASERPASVTEGAVAADEIAPPEASALEDAAEAVPNAAAGQAVAPPPDPGAAGGGEYAEQERGAQEDLRENRPLAAARLAEADPPAARELQQAAAKQEPAGARARADAEPVERGAPRLEVADDLAAGIGRDRPGGPVWSVVERLVAERWSGGRLLQVEGLPVEDYAITLSEGVELVRVGQSLPGGERLELVYAAPSETNEVLARPPARQAPAEESREAAEPSPAPPGSLTVQVAGVSVTIHAPVAADSLRVLGSRIR